ncbi:MAG: NUDIX hydrolase N-terminal domain-containing protein [Anaerolineales bacterium]|nr:NUDIX hydrolase N-terminal domain-containing protein [Anaerolineales bacterium]
MIDSHPQQPAQQIAFWADKIRDMAALGLVFSDNFYERERCERLQSLALEMMAYATDTPLPAMEPLRATVFARPTPAAVVDTAVIDNNGRLLLIRRADNHKWAMPGGALEVGETPKEGGIREVHEETGVRCEITNLIGVFDSRLCGSETAYHLYHMTFLARPLNGDAPDPVSHALEIEATGWFSADELPENIDSGHVGRIPLAFEMWRGEKRPYFDR